jgi:two-component system, NtrC family, response regulator HydG
MKKPFPSAALRILIVDDDHDNAASLGELFEIEGHSVCEVHNGQAAVDAYMAQNFDLAFMDVMMPGKNGVESFLEIRRMKPEARVFMMSGYSVEELMRQAVAGGALGFLDKPLVPEEVIRLTESVGKGGIVLSASSERDAALAIEDALSHVGRSCKLIRSSNDLDAIHSKDSVVVIDTHSHLIDEVAVYRNLRSLGHEGPAILIPKQQIESPSPQSLFRDVGVTGILNKPFDPMDLLQRLQQLAA